MQMTTRLFTHQPDSWTNTQSAGPQCRSWNASTTSRSQRVITPEASEGTVGELLALAALPRADDRVADLCRPIAVLEGGAVRRDVGIVGDRPEQVVELVHERVAPADDVAGRPPELPERMVGLGDQHGGEPARATAVPEHLELVEPLHVERDRALRAVDLPLEGVATPEGEACRLDRPHRAVLELDRGLDAVVDLAAGQERLHEGRDRGDVAGEVAGEIDHVGAEVAERTAARLVGVEAPGVE